MERFFRPAVSFLFYSFLWTAKVLPYGAYRCLSRFLLSAYYVIAGRLRRNAVESLTIAFGDSLPSAEKHRISRESFFNLGEGIAGHLYGMFHPEVTRDIFIFEGQEHLERALMDGRGAIMAIAHFGPFVWMLLAFILQGHKTHVVMRQPRSLVLKDEFLKVARNKGLHLLYSVPLRECVLECSEALRSNGLLFMPVDQNYGAAGRVFVDFFGRKAATAPGPAVFALKTRAPVFPVFAIPAKDGRVRIVIERPLAIIVGKTERETLVRNTAALTARVEEYVRKYPEQWSWMHRRWKAVPRDGEID